MATESFDIRDLCVRTWPWKGTLHEVMQQCAVWSLRCRWMGTDQLALGWVVALGFGCLHAAAPGPFVFQVAGR